MRKVFFLLFLIIFSCFGFERIGKGFYCIKYDNGEEGVRQWATSTIQNEPNQQIKKILNFSDIPDEIWEKIKNIFLEIYCTSWDHDRGGFDEFFEIIINGKVHKYSLGILPNPNRMEWVQFVFDKEEFKKGENEIIVKKSEGKTGEYLYIGIDTSVEKGKSFASYDGGKTWTNELNVHYKVKGEYLIRLYLITDEAPLFEVENIVGKEIKDKRYSGDNRLILPKSPHRRQGLAPRCRLIASWG